MATVKFRCKELGIFQLSNYYTYLEYKRVYPDIEPVENGFLFRDIEYELNH